MLYYVHICRKDLKKATGNNGHLDKFEHLHKTKGATEVTQDQKKKNSKVTSIQQTPNHKSLFKKKNIFFFTFSYVC